MNTPHDDVFRAAFKELGFDMGTTAMDRQSGPLPRIQPFFAGLVWDIGIKTYPPVEELEDELMEVWDELYDDATFLAWYRRQGPRLSSAPGPGWFRCITFQEDREQLGWRRTRRYVEMLAPAQPLLDSSTRRAYYRSLIQVFFGRLADRVGVEPAVFTLPAWTGPEL